MKTGGWKVRRERRPVGEPAPLPHDLSGAARLWLIVLTLLVLGYAIGRMTGVLGRTQRAVDAWFDGALADLRRTGGASVGTWIDRLLPWELLIVLRWAIAIAATRRWRHLAVYVGSVAVVTILARVFPTAGVAGTGVPGKASEAMAGTAVTLLGVVYGLAPAGRSRRAAIVTTSVVLIAVATALVLTLEDTFSEVAIGFAIGTVVPFLGYRVFVPESVYPVAPHRGRAAHLELTDRRRSDISRAIAHQLGTELTCVETFGLGASGGCTPLKLTVGHGDRLFGKLYATSHLRADRWYKLGRTIRFGALEDERSFNSVRRMVEYEDHMLRYLRDHGIRTPAPVSFVELAPEREYVFLCGFVDDATEIDRAPIDDGVLRSGIALLRSLRDAGVAHRDIKPGNLLVSDGEVVLIDVFFCQIRPSPWRASVDLANMLLTLAPPREPIPIQRWTVRRIGLTAGLAAGVAIAFAVTAMNLESAGF